MGLEAEKGHYHEVRIFTSQAGGSNMLWESASIQADRKQPLICHSRVETASAGVAGLWYFSSFSLSTWSLSCVQCWAFLECSLVCLLDASLQCPYKALTNLQHAICCVQSISVGGWHSAGSIVSSGCSNFHPSQALKLPTQEHSSVLRSM